MTRFRDTLMDHEGGVSDDRFALWVFFLLSDTGVSFINDLFARILSALYHERFLACSSRSLCWSGLLNRPESLDRLSSGSLIQLFIQMSTPSMTRESYSV